MQFLPESKENRVKFVVKSSEQRFYVKCCCLLVPSFRVLPRISSIQMGREVVQIHSRMNGTSLAHLLVPLYTQQNIYIFLPVSFLLFFLSLSIFYFSVRGTLVVFSRKSVYGFCDEHTSTLPA